MDLIDFLDPEQERFPQKRRFRTTTQSELY